MPRPRMPACSAVSETPKSGITNKMKNSSTMIGMPRSRLTTPALTLASSPMPDTRIAAQTRPSRVEISSEPSVTSTLSLGAWRRMGRNSRTLCRKALMGGVCQWPVDRAGGSGPEKRRRSVVQAPLLEDRVDAAVGLELGQRSVHLGHGFGIALARGDADVVDHGRLVGRGHAQVREQVPGNRIGRNR